jgi:hypothetical protein
MEKLILLWHKKLNYIETFESALHYPVVTSEAKSCRFLIKFCPVSRYRICSYGTKVIYYLNSTLKCCLWSSSHSVPILYKLMKLFFSFVEVLDEHNIRVLTAMSMKVAVFWDVAPCSLIDFDWLFRGASNIRALISLVKHLGDGKMTFI